MLVQDVIAKLPPPPTESRYGLSRLDPPKYKPEGWESSTNIALGVKSMKYHTTDEGYQLMLALEHADYLVCGHGWPCMDITDVKTIMSRIRPTTCVIQDKREWDGKTAGPGFDQRERFMNIHVLKHCHGTFKITVLKDAQNQPHYHRDSADEMDCHAWIVYYSPEIVCALAPYVRKEHLVRTYHSIDSTVVPDYKEEGRKGALLSGAVSNAYPWRERLVKTHQQLNQVNYLQHPGYRRDRCYTPDYLTTLSRYKVAICTASRYGYALRKMIEATACGCIVLTDLPEDDVLPYIDGNLIRVDPTITAQQLNYLLAELYKQYDPAVQQDYAERAKKYYDYRYLGAKLAADINAMRLKYMEVA